ncbi:hypothetical protein SAMCCGM7_pB0423 (plasmid) [Sinorhizobium americanum CCGM7]|nr:hypothetical protein SAMCCGM7_pB0423 [Sinorhizobium americanum CCGM7]
MLGESIIKATIMPMTLAKNMMARVKPTVIHSPCKIIGFRM